MANGKWGKRIASGSRARCFPVSHLPFIKGGFGHDAGQKGARLRHGTQRHRGGEAAAAKGREGMDLRWQGGLIAD